MYCRSYHIVSSAHPRKLQPAGTTCVRDPAPPAVLIVSMSSDYSWGSRIREHHIGFQWRKPAARKITDSPAALENYESLWSASSTLPAEQHRTCVDSGHCTVRRGSTTSNQDGTRSSLRCIAPNDVGVTNLRYPCLLGIGGHRCRSKRKKNIRNSESKPYTYYGKVPWRTALPELLPVNPAFPSQQSRDEVINEQRARLARY
jgi:hypothetical protein